VTTWPCPFCPKRMRLEARWRDHLVTDECGKVPDDVLASIATKYADQFTEAQFNRFGAGLFRRNGWRAFHDPMTTPSTDPGLPDWVFIKPPTVLFLEFKKQDGRPSAAQVRVIRDLQACTEVGGFFARPADTPHLLTLAKTH
jgi:hypothetical protein